MNHPAYIRDLVESSSPLPPAIFGRISRRPILWRISYIGKTVISMAPFIQNRIGLLLSEQ